MEHAPALLASLGLTLLLLIAVFFLQKRFELFRKLVVPLFLGALLAGVLTYDYQTPDFLNAPQPLTLVLFFAAMLLVRVISLYVFDVYLTTQGGVRVPPLLPRAVLAAAYILAAMTATRVAFPEVDFSLILGAGAVTSLVLGLALQPILTNFFAGVVISLEQPFRINDWIMIGDRDGQVVKITWRTTHLRNRNNDNMVIPNAVIADQEVTNYFYPHPLHMDRILVGTHYRHPPYRVKEALLAAAERVSAVLEKPSPDVYLRSFDDSAITYELRIWIEDIARQPRIAALVRAEIWEEFQRRDIIIPFPIRTLEIEPTARTFEIARAAPREAASKTPSASLFVTEGANRGLSLRFDDGSVTVGRAAGCDLVLADVRASGEHFRVEWRDGYVLIDQNSRHGTRVNGHSVERERALKNLDRISIGETQIVFEAHVN